MTMPNNNEDLRDVLTHIIAVEYLDYDELGIRSRSRQQVDEVMQLISAHNDRMLAEIKEWIDSEPSKIITPHGEEPKLWFYRGWNAKLDADTSVVRDVLKGDK